MFPIHAPPTRHGIEQGLRGQPHTGPGSYDRDPVRANIVEKVLDCLAGGIVS